MTNAFYLLTNNRNILDALIGWMLAAAVLVIISYYTTPTRPLMGSITPRQIYTGMIIAVAIVAEMITLIL